MSCVCCAVARGFVLPSRVEPQGIVNLEAMAAGRAVVASKTGGVPEIVLDGQTGVLVEPDNAESLAHALREMAENPARCAALGAAGWEARAKFRLGRFGGAIRNGLSRGAGKV